MCYELVLTDSAKTSDAEWMTLAIRHKRPTDEVSSLNEYKINKSVYTDTPDDDFKFICAVTETSMILRGSKYIGNITLQDVQSSLGGMNLDGKKDRYEFRALVNKLTDK